jgi:hypothetical protein
MGIGASAAGAVLSAGGAYNQAQGERSSLSYQASVQQNNAQIAGWQASDALHVGQVTEEDQDLKTGATISSQRAGLAANGVDLGTGSANDVLTTSSFMGARDAAQIHDNAMMQAWGYRTQQQNYTDNASQLNSMRDGINPMLAMGTSLLTGVGNVADSYDKVAKANGTPNFTDTLKAKWSSLWGSKK